MGSGDAGRLQVLEMLAGHPAVDLEELRVEGDLKPAQALLISPAMIQTLDINLIWKRPRETL